MVNPRAKHATRHKFLLKRLVKTLRSAWGSMLIEMEPTAHLSYSNPKQPDVAAANTGKGHVRLVGDLKLTSSLACKGGDRLGRLEGGGPRGPCNRYDFFFVRFAARPGGR